MKDPRAILGVPWDADPRHIKAAYKHLAAKYHPDRNHAPDAVDRLKEVIEAYEFLTDPGRTFRGADETEQSSRTANASRRSTASTMDTAEFRRQAQFRYAFDKWILTLHRPSWIPWRPMRMIAAIAFVFYIVVSCGFTGTLVTGSAETYADEVFFLGLLLISLSCIVVPERYSEMPMNLTGRGRFDVLIPEWVVEGYGWIAMLITIAAVQMLSAGS